jgi:hypothetical protein
MWATKGCFPGEGEIAKQFALQTYAQATEDHFYWSE